MLMSCFTILVLMASLQGTLLQTEHLPAASFHFKFHTKFSASDMIKSSLCSSKVGCGAKCAIDLGCKSFFYKTIAKMCHLYKAGVVRSVLPKAKKEGQLYIKGSGSMKTGIPGIQAPMLLMSHSEGTLSQVFLQNSSVEKHPYLQPRYVKALVFISSSQRLLIASSTPNSIWSVALDGKNRSLIDKGKCVVGMALDDSKQTIFVSSLGHAKVFRLFVNGTNCTDILKLNSHQIYSLSLDTKQKLVYGNSHTHVFSATYNGENIRMIRSCSPTTVLVVDADLQVLYYNMGKVLYQMSLVHNISTEIRPLLFVALNIAYQDDTIYASPLSGRSMGIIRLNQTRDSYVKLSTDGALLFDVIFCLIP